MKGLPVLKNLQMARIAGLPLRLIPSQMVLPVLYGSLRGRRWVTGSAVHRCWLGFYEREKAKFISREVHSNKVFWDVGANVGFYSLLASQLVGPGRVFAFEPLPRNIKYLKRHLALNHVENVEVLEVAASNKSGTSLFETEVTGFMGRLSERGPISVQTVTLDSLVADGRVLPPDYIKMDIEGAEFDALEGAQRTMNEFRPALFLATHGRHIEEDCRQLLTSWGYECLILQDGGNSELGEIWATYGGSPVTKLSPVRSAAVNGRVFNR